MAQSDEQESDRGGEDAARERMLEERLQQRLALQKKRQEENRQIREAERRARMEAERAANQAGSAPLQPEPAPEDNPPMEVPEMSPRDELPHTAEHADDAALAAIDNTVKLVIWDLDETFWKGTLSEGGMTPIPENIEMVKTLVDRGIMSSICSKNDFETAKAELEKLGIWDLFVFPHIDWTPKGQAIKSMLDRAGLRAPNALFLDDNHMNLQEATFFNEGLMTYDANQDLAPLMDLKAMKGKDDSAHSRLNQYKVMEVKQADQSQGALDNIEFLRQSEIKVEIINDLEPHMDRVLELINRTNQLNFTKKRVETPEARVELDELLATSGVHAGVVRATDRYGDYGIVGFFAARVKFSGINVHHFCFSCRTLNMGVEQFVWERIGSPVIDVKGSVANPIRNFDNLDWITEARSSDQVFSQTDGRSLCLVGGCDLLQVSFYCGTDRNEFVNKEQEGYLVRYDDPGFFLNPRDPLKHEPTLKKFPTWSWKDMVNLDKALATSDVILLSLYYSVPGDTFFTFGGKKWGGEYLVKVPPRTMRKFIKSDQALWFAKSFYHRPIQLEQAVTLTRRSMIRAAKLARKDADIFVVTAATKTGQQAERTQDIRAAYNGMCAEFCAAVPNAHLVDLDQLLEMEDFQDSDHYTRAGYFKIAKFVNDYMDAKAPRQTEETPHADAV